MNIPDVSKNSFRTSVSHDVCEHANGFEDWVDNRYHQLERKANFQGYISDCILNGNIRITQEIIDTPLIEQIGRVPSNKVLIVNLQSGTDVLLNGRFVNAGSFHFSSGKPIHAVAKSPIKAFIITLDKDYFLEHIAGNSQLICERLPFETYVAPIAGSVLDFEKSVSNLFSENSNTPAESTLLGNPQRVMNSIREILLATNDSANPHLSQSTRAYIVDKSCEFFFHNFCDESIGVLELCNHLRVSRRTLQYSFESIMGMSPSNYIRIVRLNVARKLLLLSPSERIQGAAMDAGFNHLGRFSKYYHEFYGELPSETLSRCLNRKVN
ncbi:transcriptional regulator EutR [compost metagenome]